MLLLKAKRRSGAVCYHSLCGRAMPFIWLEDGTYLYDAVPLVKELLKAAKLTSTNYTDTVVECARRCYSARVYFVGGGRYIRPSELRAVCKELIEWKKVDTGVLCKRNTLWGAFLFSQLADEDVRCPGASGYNMYGSGEFFGYKGVSLMVDRSTVAEAVHALIKTQVAEELPAIEPLTQVFTDDSTDTFIPQGDVEAGSTDTAADTEGITSTKEDPASVDERSEDCAGKQTVDTSPVSGEALLDAISALVTKSAAPVTLLSQLIAGKSLKFNLEIKID